MNQILKITESQSRKLPHESSSPRTHPMLRISEKDFYTVWNKAVTFQRGEESWGWEKPFMRHSFLLLLINSIFWMPPVCQAMLSFSIALRNPTVIFFFFLPLNFFNLRIFPLQNFVVFCHTSTKISHRYIHVPSLPKLPPLSLPIPPF